MERQVTHPRQSSSSLFLKCSRVQVVIIPFGLPTRYCMKKSNFICSKLIGVGDASHLTVSYLNFSGHSLEVWGWYSTFVLHTVLKNKRYTQMKIFNYQKREKTDLNEILKNRADLSSSKYENLNSQFISWRLRGRGNWVEMYRCTWSVPFRCRLECQH